MKQESLAFDLGCPVRAITPPLLPTADKVDSRVYRQEAVSRVDHG